MVPEAMSSDRKVSEITMPNSWSTKTKVSMFEITNGTSGSGPIDPSDATPRGSPVATIPSWAFLMATSSGVPCLSISPENVPS